MNVVHILSMCMLEVSVLVKLQRSEIVFEPLYGLAEVKYEEIGVNQRQTRADSMGAANMSQL